MSILESVPRIVFRCLRFPFFKQTIQPIFSYLAGSIAVLPAFYYPQPLILAADVQVIPYIILSSQM